jgi:hypothetical protein
MIIRTGKPKKQEIIPPEKARLAKKRAKAKEKKRRYRQKKGEYLTVLEIIELSRLSDEDTTPSLNIQYEKTITWLKMDGYEVVPVQPNQYKIVIKDKPEDGKIYI